MLELLRERPAPRVHSSAKSYRSTDKSDRSAPPFYHYYLTVLSTHLTLSHRSLTRLHKILPFSRQILSFLTVLRQHFTKSCRSLDTFDPFSPFSDPIEPNLTVLPTHSPLSYRSPSAFGIFFPFFYRFLSMLLLQVHDPLECPRIPRRNAPAAWYSLSLQYHIWRGYGFTSDADTCAHRQHRILTRIKESSKETLVTIAV